MTSEGSVGIESFPGISSNTKIRSTSALINEEASEPFAEPELEEKKEEEAVAPEVSPVKLEALSKPVEEPTAAFVAAVTKLEPEAKVEEEAVNPCQG
ncbi:Hypothetical predicted protein [Cloeon dipterum]|uniref:Uncharacterized protein n=1 Tax=Cloeon dipterum TaxID=197152 RepID=A0A8S1CL93_9INSE|nr:Hypothetical predicted protein [Cloeon dipterum]